MFKKLLIKLANKIIDKFGTHVIDTDSLILMYGSYFKIVQWNLCREIDGFDTLDIKAHDVSYSLKNKIG